MKKLFIFLTLSALFSLFFIGCSKVDPTPSEVKTVNTFSEFDEKYRRADYEAFLRDPSAFVKDLMAVSYNPSCPPEDVPVGDGWILDADNSEKSEDVSVQWYDKECVLFNKVFSYSADVFTYHKKNTCKYFIDLSFDSGDVQTNLALAKSLYFCYVDLFGDPTEITIDEENASEPALLRILDGTTEPQDFSVYFGDGKCITFWAFARTWDGDGIYSSHLRFSAHDY